MSMDLLYKDANNDIQDVINMSNINCGAFQRQIDHVIQSAAENAGGYARTAQMRYDREQNVQAGEEFPDHEYLNHLRQDRDQGNNDFNAVNQLRASWDLYREDITDRISTATMMKLCAYVLQDEASPRYTQVYATRIIMELIDVLNYQGDLEVYFS
tara:strand:- start:10265 stop:10732 length:468 start_codon:yes stop_codon:yes gene_type:complete